MPDQEKIQKFISENIRLITVDAKGVAQAQERAGKFLIASSVLVSALKDLEISMAKTKTLSDATFAQAMQGDGKVTEKKVAANADVQFVQAREAHEENEAFRSYLKGFIRIFENSSILFRQLARVE